MTYELLHRPAAAREASRSVPAIVVHQIVPPPTGARHRLAQLTDDGDRRGAVLQRTVGDVVSAQNAFSSFRRAVDLQGQSIHQDAALLRQSYLELPEVKQAKGPEVFAVKHPNEFVESSSVALRHDAEELETKAGGYLYQAKLRAALGKEMGVVSRGGTSNKTEPDIIARPKGAQDESNDIAVEAKKTATTAWGAPLKSAVQQLTWRQKFGFGIASVQLTNFEFAERVRKDDTVKLELKKYAFDELGTQKRAWRNTSYKQIIVEFRDFLGEKLFECKFTIDNKSGEVDNA